MENFDQDLEILKLAADCEKEILNDLNSLDDSLKFKVVEELKLENYCNGSVSKEVSKLEKLYATINEQKLLYEKTVDEKKVFESEFSSFKSNKELSNLSAKEITNLASLYKYKSASITHDMLEEMEAFIKVHNNNDEVENQENISIDPNEDDVNDEVVFRICHETPTKQVFEALFPNDGVVDSKEFWIIYDREKSEPNDNREVKEVQLKNWPVSLK